MKLMAPVPLDEEVKLMITCPKREWGLSWWEQYCLLSLRGIKERRHDYFSWLRVTQVLSTAIILGLLWWQSDITSQRPTRSGRATLLYCCILGFLSGIHSDLHISSGESNAEQGTRVKYV